MLLLPWRVAAPAAGRSEDAWTSLPGARSVLRLDMAGAVLSAATSVAVSKFDPARQGSVRLVKASIVAGIVMIYQLHLIKSFPQPYLRYRSLLAILLRLQFFCVLMSYFTSESYRSWVTGLSDAPGQASQLYGMFFANAAHAIAVGVLMPLPWHLQLLTYALLASAQVTGLLCAACLPSSLSGRSVPARLCDALSELWPRAAVTCGSHHTMLPQLLFIVLFFATAVPLILCYIYQQHLQWAVRAEQGRNQPHANIKSQLITFACVPLLCYIICVAAPFAVPVAECPPV